MLKKLFLVLFVVGSPLSAMNSWDQPSSKNNNFYIQYGPVFGKTGTFSTRPLLAFQEQAKSGVLNFLQLIPGVPTESVQKSQIVTENDIVQDPVEQKNQILGYVSRQSFGLFSKNRFSFCGFFRPMNTSRFQNSFNNFFKPTPFYQTMLPPIDPMFFKVPVPFVAEQTKSALPISLEYKVVLLTGCARNISSNVYYSSAVGAASDVKRGFIVSVRRVTVKPENLSDNTLGMVAGGLGGALVGQTIGRGSGRLLAAGAGGLLGATAGAFAQDHLSTQTAFEYVVRLDNGETKSVVQGEDTQLAPGERVLLMVTYVSGKARSRVMADRA